MSTNATFIDSLLDKWSTTSSTYFADAVATAATAAAIDNTIFETIQKKIKNLYLVFHYPQYTNSDNNNPTEFVSGNTKPNPIIATDRIFNYIYTDDSSQTKLLLSTLGISKDDMVSLKMILEKLVESGTNEETAYKFLIENHISTSNPGSTLGGNNTILPKTSGGKGKNRSNKRIKKLRKRNKSSKSQL